MGRGAQSQGRLEQTSKAKIDRKGSSQTYPSPGGNHIDSSQSNELQDSEESYSSERHCL